MTRLPGEDPILDNAEFVDSAMSEMSRLTSALRDHFVSLAERHDDTIMHEGMAKIAATFDNLNTRLLTDKGIIVMMAMIGHIRERGDL